MPDTEKVRKCSSRMKGNFQVRFRGEKGGEILQTYPTKIYQCVSVFIRGLYSDFRIEVLETVL